jgi:hypothetical protein
VGIYNTTTKNMELLVNPHHSSLNDMLNLATTQEEDSNKDSIVRVKESSIFCGFSDGTSKYAIVERPSILTVEYTTLASVDVHARSRTYGYRTSRTFKDALATTVGSLLDQLAGQCACCKETAVRK